MCRLPIRRQTERSDDPLSVKTDDDVITDSNNWHTHLTALLNHLLALFKVARDVDVGELHVIGGKEILCRVAKGAGRSRINGDLFLVHRTMLISDNEIVAQPRIPTFR